ncbi:MAG: tyrosine-type recombinase/integrase [Clostridia bacterium]
MKADYIFKDTLHCMLNALTNENRLALETSMQTGLRISDVLELKTDKLSSKMTIKELKTNKSKRFYLNVELLHELKKIAGKIYIFEGRNDVTKHRTRQAVYKDLKRVAKMYRIDKSLQISPHSARKCYAVEQYHKDNDLKRVQKLLNHSTEAVTMIYAFADIITNKRK